MRKIDTAKKEIIELIGIIRDESKPNDAVDDVTAYWGVWDDLEKKVKALDSITSDEHNYIQSIYHRFSGMDEFISDILPRLKHVGF